MKRIPMLILAAAMVLSAAVPRLVKFGGVLNDAKGKPMTGVVGVTFALYEKAEGGAAVWMETQNVQVDADGQYSILLGATRNDGIPSEIFGGGERWLGIQLQGEPERPRVLLTSVPYSLKSADAETLGGLPASAYALAGTAGHPAGGAETAEAAGHAGGTMRPASTEPQQAGGSGTTNFIPIWTNSTTLGNSKMYQTAAGNVGLGTTSPTARFEAVSTGTTGAGVFGYSASTTGTTYGVTGKNSSTAGTGVQGAALATSGANYGVYGSTASPAGTAVYGAGGSGKGVAGTTSSTTGIGVLGQATATSGANYGVYGSTASTTGIGVEGNAAAGTGVAGVSLASVGYGVYGANAATSGNAIGTYGVSSSPAGYGVYGFNLATTGAAYGVAGATASNAGIGVLGQATAASGTTYGVYGSNAGTSGTAYGIYGTTTSTSGIGAVGQSTASSGSTYGVYGSTISPGGTSVYGTAVNGTGVAGGTTSSAGYGVYGANQAVSGNGVGIYGDSVSPNGIGVSAHASGGGTALVASASGGGAAALFVGSVKVSGNLTVTGTVSKGGGSFRIDHPLDPEHKYLYHSFVESPDMMNIYNGVITLSRRGDAVIKLPDWFGALNRDFRYQLTCIGAFAPVYVAREISGNEFKIAGGRPGMKVSWQVTGIRKDEFANEHRIPVEEVKSGVE